MNCDPQEIEVNRTSLRRTAVPGVAALALAVLLSACGAANETGSSASSSSGGGSLSGQLAGSGSSAQEKAQEAWTTGFQGANDGVTVTYDPVGSGDGRKQFIAKGVSFAGSDAYLSDSEGELSAAKKRCAGQDAIEVPAYISPIAVVFNLDGVDGLSLNAKTIAGIFARKITRWNDPAIKADNPGANLPGDRITPVNRSDDSGTTENFTEYLNKAGGGAWPYEPAGTWPIKGGEAADGTSGVISAVTKGSGTIGYADASQTGNLSVVKVKVGSEFVAPDPAAAAKVIEASKRVAGRSAVDMAIDVNRTTTTSGVYPVVLVSYLLACQSYPNAGDANLVKAYLKYVLSSEGQQAAAKNAGSAPLSSSVADEATGIVDKISANG